MIVSAVITQPSGPVAIVEPQVEVKAEPVIDPNKPIGYECRFATYCPAPQGSNVDLHVIKQIAHYPDGRTESQLHMLKNFRMPFWVTKKANRNHQQKKEWEDIEKVEKYMTTRHDQNQSIARALGTPWEAGKEYRKIARSPYLYGSDILSTAVIKKSYLDKFPSLKSPYSVAVFDTEKDVVRGTNQVIMATLSMGKKVFTAVQKDYLEGTADAERRGHEALYKYLSKMEVTDKDGKTEIVNLIEKRGIEWELLIVDREIDVVLECMKRAHAWKPDFVAIWNIDFDIPFIVGAVERAGMDPAEVFSDPSVPKEYRYFRYKQGPKKKKMASGKEMPIKPADQWHTVYCPASFYFIDAMCVYRKLRVAQGELPSYGLDYVLGKEECIRKLKFEEAEGLVKLDWHIFMQSNYKIEYIIYNVVDCISMEELDEKTTDLRFAMPLACGCSDFETFKSQPRRTADALHYFSLVNQKVFGSTSDQMSSELDEKTLGPDGWIVTLPAHLVAHNGLRCIEEDPNLRTNIRVHVADLDVSASYPNGGSVFNISKQTTFRELCKIEGVPEIQQRMQGINLSSGHVNAVEICCGLFGTPDMPTMLDAFKAQLGASQAVQQAA
jgi:hypothetical protein